MISQSVTAKGWISCSKGFASGKPVPQILFQGVENLLAFAYSSEVIGFAKLNT